MDRKKPRKYKAFMNIGKQKEPLKEKRMTRNMEKKSDRCCIITYEYVEL